MTPDIIVIGTSAGGVNALKKLAAQLPGDLDASLFVVLHTPSDGPALMAQLLAEAGNLKTVYPENGQTIERQQIYIAPPDHHLLLQPGFIQLVRGPKENRHRPAIDPLFRSAAVHYGPRVSGVILTGHLDDGTSGLLAVKDCGGIAIVQDPKDAHAPGMPASAMRHVPVDYCVLLAEIAPLLVKLVKEPRNGGVPVVSTQENFNTEAEVTALQADNKAITDQLGKRSTLTCPECGGTLWQMNDDRVPRYRCHVGHALTAEHLSIANHEALEKALWLALKTLEESGTLALQMAARAEKDGDSFAMRLFEARANEAVAEAAVLRRMLLKIPAEER